MRHHSRSGFSYNPFPSIFHGIGRVSERIEFMPSSHGLPFLAQEAKAGNSQLPLNPCYSPVLQWKFPDPGNVAFHSLFLSSPCRILFPLPNATTSTSIGRDPPPIAEAYFESFPFPGAPLTSMHIFLAGLLLILPLAILAKALDTRLNSRPLFSTLLCPISPGLPPSSLFLGVSNQRRFIVTASTQPTTFPSDGPFFQLSAPPKRPKVAPPSVPDYLRSELRYQI